jgi:hypothetical protein
MNSEHKVLIDLKTSKLISPFRAIFRNPEGTSGPVLAMNHETGGCICTLAGCGGARPDASAMRAFLGFFLKWFAPCVSI